MSGAKRRRHAELIIVECATSRSKILALDRMLDELSIPAGIVQAGTEIWIGQRQGSVENPNGRRGELPVSRMVQPSSEE